MKKNIFLLKGLQRISRNELRKIGGGNGDCSVCGAPILSFDDGECVFAGGTQFCRGFITDGLCCE